MSGIDSLPASVLMTEGVRPDCEVKSYLSINQCNGGRARTRSLRSVCLAFMSEIYVK